MLSKKYCKNIGKIDLVLNTFRSQAKCMSCIWFLGGFVS